MEWRPLSYEHYSKLTARQSFLREAKTGRQIMDESGDLMSPLEAKQVIEDVNTRMQERIGFMDELDRKNRIKYFVHKWMFVVGLSFLAVSRAINLFSSQLISAK